MKKNHDLLAGLVLGVIVGIHYGGQFVPFMTILYVLGLVFVLPIVQKMLH